MLDNFPGRLRQELESAYTQDLDGVFDVTAVRSALEDRLRGLNFELNQANLPAVPIYWVWKSSRTHPRGCLSETGRIAMTCLCDGRVAYTRQCGSGSATSRTSANGRLTSIKRRRVNCLCIDT